MFTALAVAAEEAHELAPLVLPIWAFPLIAAVFFLVAFIITWSYRDVSHRHAHKASAAAHDDHEHGAHH